jgi:hypothetical protein
MDVLNTIYISQGNHYVFMVLKLSCENKKYEILKIKIINNCISHNLEAEMH